MARTLRKNNRRRATRRRYVARKRNFSSNRTRLGRTRRMMRIYRNPLGSINQKAVLHYNTNISLDPQAEILGPFTGSNVYQFCGNSLYDPDQTGAGHQPMYFDNYMSVYEKYRVNYAQITVTVINHAVNTLGSVADLPTSFPNYSYKLFIFADTSLGTSDFPSFMNNILEEGGAQLKWRFIAPSLTGKLPKLKHSASPHYLARKPFKDDTLEGTASSGPSQPLWFYIGMTSADGVTNPPSVYLNVHIKYYCEFYDRKFNQGQN